MYEIAVVIDNEAAPDVAVGDAFHRPLGVVIVMLIPRLDADVL